MSDIRNSLSDQDPSETAQDLARSYENFREQQEHDVNGLDDETPVNDMPEPVEPEAPPPLKRIVEALLFVGSAPLTAASAAEVIRGLTADQFTETIASLNQDYRRQGRPYLIHLHDQGYVLELRPRYKPIWDKLYGTMREARLSTAALDVLPKAFGKR